MGVLDAFLNPARQIAELSGRLRTEQDENLALEESLADLEQLAMEDRGWLRLTAHADQEFSLPGLQRISQVARVSAVAHPLLKRGLNLRAAYVWGQGVTITAAGGESGQDVDAVVQAFLDDESNRATFTDSQARIELERTCFGCDGNMFLALVTSPRTGRVQVRLVPFEQITNVHTDPEDATRPWYYKRTIGTNQHILHPALGYRPATRPRSIDGIEVRWDTPVLHATVNGHADWTFGVGDVYASLGWDRMYRDFLTDWAKLMRALSRFAWRLSGDKSSKARAAAVKIREATDNIGATAAMGPGANLEAIPKTGATIDADSGRPLATMVAAGLEMPVTMLLTDPGLTGARATAETLDRPTELGAQLRQDVWSGVHRRILGHVIDSAVRAPAGPLRGTVERDDAQTETVTLNGDVPKTVRMTWPDIDDESVLSQVQAVVAADSTGRMPGAETLRLLLQALRVDDAETILDNVTDDDGRLIDDELAEALGHRHGDHR